MSTVGEAGGPSDHGRRRRYAFPQPGERLSAFATRRFPDDPGAAARLLSWNLHLVMRRSLSAETQPGSDPELLGTDIVYLEAPVADRP